MKKKYVDVLIFLLMPLEICIYCGPFKKVYVFSFTTDRTDLFIKLPFKHILNTKTM